MGVLRDLLNNFTKARSMKHTSMLSFNKATLDVLDNTLLSTKRLAPAVAEELFREIVPNTPHLTGRAQANWDIDDQPITNYKETATQANGAVNLPNIPKNTSKLYVGNAAPYIDRLEAGWSKTQGGHMVANAIKKIKNEFQGGVN
ncbi:hypothetical protein KA005_49730 [bacterium]|nr:hypothetical protein [bacterium]